MPEALAGQPQISDLLTDLHLPTGVLAAQVGAADPAAVAAEAIAATVRAGARCRRALCKCDNPFHLDGRCHDGHGGYIPSLDGHNPCDR